LFWAFDFHYCIAAFDDYTDLLLSSVPEMKLGWLEEIIAHRKMKNAKN
jgi:peptide/nickel transport system ATP-binding protein